MRAFALVCFVYCAVAPAAGAAETFSAGIARVDVTPTEAIRLCGYAARQTTSNEAEQRLWAKALAIASRDSDPAVLITVDNIGVPGVVVEEVARRLTDKARLPRERLVVCSSHTHCGPCVAGNLPNMFGHPIPPEQTAAIERYTKSLTDALEKVALEALLDRRPAHLAWAQGEVGFAANRRTPGGPVDHAMPMLAVTGDDGKLRAVVVNYACHCTTLGPDFNKACGDWAGYAQQYIEQQHPGAVAMVTIGCAGDANPEPRGTLQNAQDHGREIAQQVEKLLKGTLTPLTSPVHAELKRISLAYDKLPTKEQWQEMAKRDDAPGNNAKLQLAKLQRGEPIPNELPYVVQTWAFGDQLAMVFLAGEVVVDYDLRLKHDFDPKRLWVSAYSNDVPCYIPSRRVLAEGGYEAEGAMVYYGRPGRLAPGVENDIIRTVHELMPRSFRTQQSLNEFPPPLSPQQALGAFRTHDDLKVELVASEPLIVDPVAIDWGPDGRLWVVEMNDYPTGLHENHTPGGRIKVLESSHHDGHYDKATIFLDGLRMPTGVMVWGKGALICAAPDIIYAEDTDGDGKADVKKVLCTGFGPDNEQWLVNGLAWGLDNWVYGASSISNGPIHVTTSGATIDLGNRDFRLHPDTGVFEPAAGRTQYCRVRDDWGNWFGNDNSNLLWHYPLPEHYLRRNPHVTYPPSHVLVPGGYDVNQLYPASRILPRFNDPGSAGRTTSACGPCIYRDNLLGEQYVGNAFSCEPVHDLVTRLVLEPEGASFTGHRSADEQHSEFLAATDNWFRPVQVRTGPDGALWVVDMYRFVIEHPRWITPERLVTLDVRAGADKGRIYRIYPKEKQPRAVPDLKALSTNDLARAIDTPNGTLRDMVHMELVRRGDRSAVGELEDVSAKSKLPAVRLQALAALDGLGALRAEVVERGLDDPHPGVRANAVRLAERFLKQTPSLAERLLRRVDDPNPRVRFQLALSVGEWDDPWSAQALARVAVKDLKDEWVRAAVSTSAVRSAAPVLAVLLDSAADTPERGELVEQLVATVAATGDEAALREVATRIAPASKPPPEHWQFSTLATLLDTMERRKLPIERVASQPQVRRAIELARAVATDREADESLRESAIRLWGLMTGDADEDLRRLAMLLAPREPEAVQSAALAALAHRSNPNVANALLSAWEQALPAKRAAILDTLLSRDAWVSALLVALDRKAVRPAEITAPARARLLSLPDESQRKRSAELLSAGGPTARKSVIDQFKPALSLKGDPNRGGQTFQRLCTACHRLNGQGNAVGPDLTALTDRSPQALSVAILDPNAAVDGKYVSYTLQLRDGRTLNGIIADESSTGLTLLQGNGVRDAVLRSDIARLKSTGLSLMPEGLETGLTPQDLADLMAYVAAAKPER